MKSHLLALIAIITATAIFQLSNSVLTSLIPIRLGLAEVGGFATSLVATAFSVGFLLGCLRVVRIIRSVGHIRAFAAFAGATAMTTLMLQLSIAPVFWFVLRMVQGACLAGLFTVADSWINEKTPNAVRGQILGIYFIAITCALISGQLLLYFFDVASAVLVMIVSGLFSLALIPVALTTSTSPEPPEVVTVNLWRLYHQVPAAVFGCFVVGAMGAAFLNMTPYFLTSVAVPAAQIGLLMGTVHVTRLALQWPVGLMSDKFDRRIVIVASSVLIFVLAALFAFMAPGGGQLFHDPSLEARKWIAFGLFGLLGAFSVMLYSVCIAHAHDRGSPEESVAITSTLLLIWSVGAMVGLLVLGVLIEVVGGHVIFWFTGGMAAILAVHTGWRLVYRERPEQTGRFKEVPITSPVISELEPSTEENENVDERGRR